MRKHIARRLLIVAIVINLVMILSSCQEDSGTIANTIEVATLIPTNTNIPSPEPTSTVTSVPPTPTPEPFVSQCVSMLDELPEIDDFEGRIIVQTEYSNGIKFISNLDVDPQSILNAYSFTIVISPDHTMIAYISDSIHELTISDVNGNVIKSFQTDPTNTEQELNPVQWLDNQHILMYARGAGEYPNYLAPYAVIFNVESGTSEKIQMDFPGINLVYHQIGFQWPQEARLVISPDLQTILYPSLVDTTGYLIIWDRNREAEVARFPGIHPLHTVPRWSQEGNLFATMFNLNRNGDDLFLIDRFGNYRKVTTFDPNNPGDISHLSWSPDDQKIAFWMHLYKTEERHPYGDKLFVINLETGSVINYCIEGDGEIYWSKNGKYLLIDKYIEGGRGDEFSITLVNLEDFWAVELLEFAEVYGILYEQ